MELLLSKQQVENSIVHYLRQRITGTHIGIILAI